MQKAPFFGLNMTVNVDKNLKMLILYCFIGIMNSKEQSVLKDHFRREMYGNHGNN